MKRLLPVFLGILVGSHIATNLVAQDAVVFEENFESGMEALGRA